MTGESPAPPPLRFGHSYTALAIAIDSAHAIYYVHMPHDALTSCIKCRNNTG